MNMVITLTMRLDASKAYVSIWSEQDGAFIDSKKIEKPLTWLGKNKTAKNVQPNERAFDVGSDGEYWETNRYDGNTCDILDALALGTSRAEMGGFGHAKSYKRRGKMFCQYVFAVRNPELAEGRANCSKYGKTICADIAGDR